MVGGWLAVSGCSRILRKEKVKRKPSVGFLLQSDAAVTLLHMGRGGKGDMRSRLSDRQQQQQQQYQWECDSVSSHSISITTLLIPPWGSVSPK